MKLSEFVRLVKADIGTDILAVSNIDDFFFHAGSFGIKKFEVDRSEMDKIVLWYLANVGSDKNGNQGEVIREKKLDKFLGIEIELK